MGCCGKKKPQRGYVEEAAVPGNMSTVGRNKKPTVIRRGKNRASVVRHNPDGAAVAQPIAMQANQLSSPSNDVQDALARQKWFHGKLDVAAAKQVLKASKPTRDGTFLIYENAKGAQEGNRYGVALYHNRSTHHIRIFADSSPWKLLDDDGQGTFVTSRSVVDLVHEMSRSTIDFLPCVLTHAAAADGKPGAVAMSPPATALDASYEPVSLDTVDKKGTFVPERRNKANKAPGKAPLHIKGQNGYNMLSPATRADNGEYAVAAKTNGGPQGDAEIYPYNRLEPRDNGGAHDDDEAYEHMERAKPGAKAQPSYENTHPNQQNAASVAASSSVRKGKAEPRRCGNFKQWNNPGGCSNVEGTGKAKKKFGACSGCRKIFYCSAECQQTDWKRGHGKVCGKVNNKGASPAAAAAAAEAAQRPAVKTKGYVNDAAVVSQANNGKHAKKPQQPQQPQQQRSTASAAGAGEGQPVYINERVPPPASAGAPAAAKGGAPHAYENDTVLKAHSYVNESVILSKSSAASSRSKSQKEKGPYINQQVVDQNGGGEGYLAVAATGGRSEGVRPNNGTFEAVDISINKPRQAKAFEKVELGRPSLPQKKREKSIRGAEHPGVDI